jgi:hypothetical protein
MGVDGQSHAQTAFHWERTTLHLNEITHKIRQIKGYGFVIFLEVKYCFYCLQWKKNLILN